MRTVSKVGRHGAALALAAALLAGLLLASAALAADKIRVGNPSVQSFSFLPLRLGIAHGFFARYGIDPEEVTLNGSAKMHQAMAAGSLDIGLGAGPDLIFPVKGDPEIAVAAMAGPPLLLSVIVPYDSPARTADDLKGKRIGVSTVNSLTQWLMRELVRQKGWDADSLTYVTVGAELPNQVAALVTGQIDAVVSSTALRTPARREQARAAVVSRLRHRQRLHDPCHLRLQRDGGEKPRCHPALSQGLVRYHRVHAR